MALAIVVSGVAIYDIIRIGDSGAQASWSDRVPTP